ncbi:MAG: D-glycerate dehydrogenase [Planctomycetes bacterium]|nr:D-glycerate dehydrogenase [Planctomycetota bacterium]
MNAKRVIVTRELPPPAVEMLSAAGFEVDVIGGDESPSRATLLDRVRGTCGILPTLSEIIDAALLDAAGSSLRVVANFAVGYDNIDVPACTQRGVRVTNTPGVLTDATADLTWALILAVARRVIEGDRLIRDGAWQGWIPTQLLGLELRGATLGIVGAGRIGTAVGLRAVGFGMKVIYCDPRENESLSREAGATRVDLDRLLADSDVVSLHVPMRAENRHLIGPRALSAMKRTAVLINSARGPIVDEGALAKALSERRIAAAGLDVYEDEPRVTRELVELPNVVLLPHLGSATTTTRQAMSRMAAENVLAVLNGRRPPNPVN